MLSEPDLDRSSIAALQSRLRTDELTSATLVDVCLRRIASHDRALGAVLALDPTAEEQAVASDERRRAGREGPLEGIPVLVKDNIAVSLLPTTAGSRALALSCPQDAPLVTRLRAAGAVILGKANLSEWANLRSSHSTSGWSAVGGQTRNPHALDRNPSGSSSGSAAAISASFAPLAIGTETDGSIVSPAGICGVVGLKPTLGTVPGEGIVPISSYQDTAGPMTRHVADAAAAFAVLAGVRTPTLHPNGLVGARLGVWTQPDVDPATADVRDAALVTLRAAGAVLVPVTIDVAGIDEHEMPALLTEFHAEIDRYLAAAPESEVANLRELVAFNHADDVELSRFDQDLFEQALAAPPPEDPEYRAHRQAATTTARRVVDTALAQDRLDAIVGLANSPAWLIDYPAGDVEGVTGNTPAAVAGYPSLTVPAGFVAGLPVGVLFFGTAGADGRMLQLGYAFEQVAAARLAPPPFPPLPP